MMTIINKDEVNKKICEITRNGYESFIIFNNEFDGSDWVTKYNNIAKYHNRIIRYEPITNEEAFKIAPSMKYEACGPCICANGIVRYKKNTKNIEEINQNAKQKQKKSLKNAQKILKILAKK